MYFQITPDYKVDLPPECRYLWDDLLTRQTKKTDTTKPKTYQPEIIQTINGQLAACTQPTPFNKEAITTRAEIVETLKTAKEAGETVVDYIKLIKKIKKRIRG